MAAVERGAGPGRRRAPATVEAFAHGMTVGTNALLEERGARTALVATARLRRPARDRPPGPPRALPPLRAEAGAAGRAGAALRGGRSGSAPRACSSRSTTAEVERLAAAVARGGAESVAICLLFSYLDPAPRASASRRACGSALPGVHVSASHEVLPRFREYERCSTTVDRRLPLPLLGRYLSALGEAAAAAGLPQPLVMQSSGGVAPRRGGGQGRRLERPLRAGRRRGRRRPAGPRLRRRQRPRLRHGRHLLRRLRGRGRRGAAHRLAPDRRPGDPAADGRRPHGRRRRRLDRLARPGRRAAGRAALGRRRARARPATGAAASEPTVTDANLLLGYLAADSRLAGGVDLDAEAAEAALSTARRGARPRPRWRPPRGSSGSPTRRWSGRCGWSRSSAASTRAASRCCPSAAPGRCTRRRSPPSWGSSASSARAPAGSSPPSASAPRSAAATRPAR